jgi:uncharacterized protein (TIRG00374 family)
LRSHWLMFVSWGVSAAALAYVLSRLRLSELSKDFSGITWWLLVAAIIVEIVPRLLESIRWQYLLRPLRMRFDRLVQAIYIGTLYSAALPLSGGDVVRSAIVARQARVSLTRVLATVLTERVADALAIILAVWFTLRGLAIPFGLRIGLALLEVGVGLAIVAGLGMAAQQVNLLKHLNGWQASSRVTRRLKSMGTDLIEAAG